MEDFIKHLEDFKKLDEYIAEKVKSRTESNAKPSYRSDSINEIAKALSTAQGEFPSIPYNRTTATWNDEYSDLDITMHYIRPIMAKYELAFTQWCEMLRDGGTVLHTTVMHSSGQWIESRIKVVCQRSDIKTFDSIMADHKRQQAFSLLGLTIKGDVKDDHAEVAMNEIREEVASGRPNIIKRPQDAYSALSEDQLNELEVELDGYPDLAQEVLDKYKIRNLSDMPKSKFRFCIDQIRKFKMYRNEDIPINK